MQRVPVYRLTFASHPMVAFDHKTMSCRYTRRRLSLSGIGKTTPAGPQPASSSSRCRRGDLLPGPGGEGLRNPFTASTDPASPQRLAVYPRAEQGYYLSGLERVEKSAKIYYYFGGYFIRH
ncbi:hypothetical protein RMR16_004285 [Agrobacterium sp. rho-13.3]|uniref:hypothetical protein n=1 Tax=Agrobacterium sp. rho-13.3 TaxID=3072980 RepID=UPI003D7AE75E